MEAGDQIYLHSEAIHLKLEYRGISSSDCSTMTCEGYGSDAAAAAENGRRPPRKRGICRSFTCISPWFIFWRRRSRFSETLEFGERNWGKGEIDEDLGLQRELETVPSSSSDNFPETGKEASLNLGVGYGLIYLLKHELNKMVELRRRIESLLQHFHTDIENQDDKRLHFPSTSSICSSLTDIHVQQILHSEEHDSGESSSPKDVKQPETEYHCIRLIRESSLRIDQLEAELEAELCRLQLPEEGESVHPEVKEEQNAAESSLELCEEAGVAHEFRGDEFHGVCARDLERKLHEVLEARQQERIEELESGLEYAMQQLQERERELARLRDTAGVVARRRPSISNTLLEVKQSMESEFEGIQRRTSLVLNSV